MTNAIRKNAIRQWKLEAKRLINDFQFIESYGDLERLESLLKQAKEIAQQETEE